MDAILNQFYQLEPSMRFYWGVAVVVSFIFLIQMVLTFIGMGDSDVDVDFSGDVDVDFSTGDTMDTGGALQLFSVRNIVNFLLGLGWGGVCWSSVISHPMLLGIAALATGVAFVALFLFMFRQLMRLQSNGAFRIADCVGQVCDVYLRIPAERQGQGKVQVSFGGSVQELAAVTDGDLLPSGSKARVLSLVDKHTVLVEKA